jgi:fumarylacetoacetase
MVPLGPLNGKSFCTTISPWVITLEALAHSKVPGPERNPKVELTSYIRPQPGFQTYDLQLSAEYLPCKPNGSNDLSDSGDENGFSICTTQFTSLYWTLPDLISHQTANGCNLNVGDLLATGTISGTTPESRGCLMESPSGVEYGTNTGPKNKLQFLKDGDTLILMGKAGDGVGFGDCVGTIQSAIDRYN